MAKYPGYVNFKVVGEQYVSDLSEGWTILEHFIVEEVHTDFNSPINNSGMSYAYNKSVAFKKVKFLLGQKLTAKRLYND